MRAAAFSFGIRLVRRYGDWRKVSMRKSLYRRHNQVFLTLLRRYREQGKFRQRDLAQHLGSGQGTVSKAETGTRRLDVIELREWLLAMGVDFLEFMTELHGRLEALATSETWLILSPPLPTAVDPPARTTGGPDAELGASTGIGDMRQAMSLFRPSALKPNEQSTQLAWHVTALAERLLPLMRSALVREMNKTLAELDNLQFRGQPLSLWIGHLGARNDQETELLLLPGEAEVWNYSLDLARLLLTNWLACRRRLTDSAVEQLMVALSSDAEKLPAGISEGCQAFPLSEAQTCSELIFYLLQHWRATDPYR